MLDERNTVYPGKTKAAAADALRGQGTPHSGAGSRCSYYTDAHRAFIQHHHLTDMTTL